MCPDVDYLTVTVDIERATALVTGANRGLGHALATELVLRGASVWAAARNPDSVRVPGATPLRLDITDPASVQAAADTASSVTLLVNNAGSSTRADVLNGDWQQLHDELEIHYFGTLRVTRQFVPVIENNGGGAVLNVLSALSWVASAPLGGYSVAKSAEWAMTNALRLQLSDRGIAVAGLHVGMIETDLVRDFAGAKSSPRDVASLAIDGLAQDLPEILIDDRSRAIQAALSQGVSALYPRFVEE